MVQLGQDRFLFGLQRALRAQKEMELATSSPSTGAMRKPARSARTTLDILNDPRF
jgi:hypothetical protein